jgi:flagellar basal body rod protein FlgG
MDPLLISAASGLKARMESLDMLANNVANTGTSGFKADREFYGLFEDQLPVIEKQWTDFSQGALTLTGNPLHVALDGPGFLAVNSPAGIVYTRAGELRISKSNQLESAASGFPLRDVLVNGRPISVDPTQAVDIGLDGTVRQGGQQVGKIEIADLNQAAGMGKLGNSYFSMAGPNPGAPPEGGVEIRQGMLEQSNVSAADAAVRLIGVMRQFEMLQRAVLIGADMNKHAVEEVARVS